MMKSMIPKNRVKGVGKIFIEVKIGIAYDGQEKRSEFVHDGKQVGSGQTFLAKDFYSYWKQ